MTEITSSCAFFFIIMSERLLVESGDITGVDGTMGWKCWKRTARESIFYVSGNWYGERHHLRVAKELSGFASTCNALKTFAPLEPPVQQQTHCITSLLGDGAICMILVITDPARVSGYFFRAEKTNTCSAWQVDVKATSWQFMFCIYTHTLNSYNPRSQSRGWVVISQRCFEDVLMTILVAMALLRSVHIKAVRPANPSLASSGRGRRGAVPVAPSFATRAVNKV